MSQDVALLARKAADVTTSLRHAYGTGRPRTERHPTDALIATILSQHTADRNSSAAFTSLKQHYPDWPAVAAAPPDELAATIRSAGLANVKARSIQAALRTLQERYGTMDLAFLRDLRLEAALELLESLPGVGPKTAACVLLFSCGLPALPVDTHVHRLACRLGLIGDRVSAAQAHRILPGLVPAGDVYDFHVNLIRHGRQVCQAQHPRCGLCVLQASCDYYRGGRWS